MEYNYEQQVLEIIESGRVLLSNVKPSEWAEKKRVMTSDVSPFPGPFSYNRTPYLREPVDCLSPNHPAKIIAVMKGAQIGFSTGVIESGIGWIIAENPGNILFLTGHSDLAEEAMTGKIDQMIHSCGIQSLIRPNVLRAKNMRTGDTNKSKEFPGGSLVAGSAGNHKLLRQRSVRYGFIDDFDAAKSASKESGSTTQMIEQRFAAYSGKMKLYYISTPELKETSNIEPVFLLGDQRRYHIPCPCCGEYISLHWTINVEGSEKEKAGIVYQLDENNKLITGSVGYKCQKCTGFFTDKDKYELNLKGFWKPTAEPSQLGYYSYHISSLYAPPGMYDWEFYVRQYLVACPPGQDRDENKYKTFVNLCLGETYEAVGAEIKANQLQKNIRDYEIGLIPERVSERDGNGKIVLLTCACDLNGTMEDARLDYSIVAWSESGSSYSVTQGSIGTFVPREGVKKFKEDRERWTYEFGKDNSVWPEFDLIIGKKYLTDTGRSMKVFISGVDCGHYTQQAYTYLDKSNNYVIGLKGKDAELYSRFGKDSPSFHHAKERGNLFLVEVGQIKDDLSDLINLKYDSGVDKIQPPGYMNYPQPSNGKYSWANYFEHYEAEKREIVHKPGQPIQYRWVKKNTNVQNHFFDVRVYNMALKEIFTSLICKEAKIKNYGWKDYVDLVLKRV